MITLIHQKPVRSNVENGEVMFNLYDVYNALSLHRSGLLKPVDSTLMIPADIFVAFVMGFLVDEMDFLVDELEAMDVWLRDAIEGNNARNLYPPSTIIGKNIADWERVCVELTGRTPNQILAEARGHGIEVESWQVALEHLDYPLSCAVYFHIGLIKDGASFEEAIQEALASVPYFRAECSDRTGATEEESVNFAPNKH